MHYQIVNITSLNNLSKREENIIMKLRELAESSDFTDYSHRLASFLDVKGSCFLWNKQKERILCS